MASGTDLAALLDDLGKPLSPADYNWDLATEFQLTPDEVFHLTYAAQVEWGTEGSFLSLNITRDRVVRRFLRIWLEQEVVHGELLKRLIEASGAEVPLVHRSVKQRYEARKGQLINRLARLGIGRDFFGLHMAWGAAHELTTMRFYSLMRERTSHPLLEHILRDVIAQEAKHYSFYKRAAIEQLTDNERGQRLLRWALQRFYRVVGTGLRSQADADRITIAMLDSEPAVVASMDGALGRIPGMENLQLVRAAVDSARARVAVA